MKFSMTSYGPTPLFESHYLDDYSYKVKERVQWRVGIAYRKNRLGTNPGQERLQFHLNSDGKISDVKVLTNTLGEELGDVYREAIVGGLGFDPWPEDASHRRRAGYFTFRAVLRFENAANSVLDTDRLWREYARANLILPENSRSNHLAVLTNFEDDPDFLIEGMSERRRDNFTAAIADFTRAIEWDPLDAWSYTYRGTCRERLKDYAGAISDLTRAIELDPQNAEAFNERSLPRRRFEDYAGMVSDCTEALKLDPQYSGAYDNRARAEMRLHDFDKAFADVGQALKYNPSNAVAFLNRARLNYSRHDYKSALSDCSRAIAFNPKYAKAYAYRGYIQEELSDFQDATSSLRKSLELDDSLNYSRFQIWILRSKSGEVDGANQELRSHFGHRPAEKKPDWPYELEAFLAGASDEGQLFTAANAPARTPQEHTDHICEAAYYAGMKHLLSNDKNGAEKLFLECISTTDEDFVEYVQAKRELSGIAQ